jgi:hypothetical protein
MHKRMPRSKSWASLGGIAPIEHDIDTKITNLSLPLAREEQRDSPGGQGDSEGGQHHHHHQHYPPEAQGHDHQPGDIEDAGQGQHHQPEVGAVS